MNKGGQEWIQEPERCHSHSHAVHGESTHKILHDYSATAASNSQSLDQLREIASNQDHIGALPSHIRSRSHGDADIGLYQGWSVVDAVTDHGDIAPFAPQLSHPLCLLLRQKSS